MKKRTNLTEKQEKVKRLITPVVKKLVMEATAPITKKFIPFEVQTPPDNKMLFLIDNRGDYGVGFYNSKTQKLEVVGTPFKNYENIGTAQFTHWAI
jgi:hypothetical protein